MSGFVIGLITAIHIVVCIALMAAILLQSGKGGGLAGTFGAGSSQTLFGGRGAATFLSRATTFLAVTFFLTSLTLGLQASRASGTRRSLIQEDARRRGAQREGTQTAPGVQPMRNQPPVTGVPTPAPGQAPQGQAPAPSPQSGPQAPAGNAPQAPAPGGTQPPATGGK